MAHRQHIDVGGYYLYLESSIQDCQPELVVDVIHQLVQDIRACRVAEETSV